MKTATLKTNVITLEDAVNKGLCTWEDENACEFHGVIPGYVCGFCVEMQNGDGKIQYTSCTFTNDYEEIRNPYKVKDYNYLGLATDCAIGWEPTGNIMFRGYFREDYDLEEREYCYEDASSEALDLLSKYMDVIKTHPEVIKRWAKY